MDKSTELGRFTSYPYRLLPSERITVWAGYPEVRAKLMRIVESARTDRIGLYQLGVLHGELGTGKSHAMRYFLNVILDAHRKDFDSIATYVPRLAVEAKTDFLALYRAILRLLRPQLVEVASRLDRTLSEAAVVRRGELGEQVGEETDVMQRLRARMVADHGGDEAPVLAALLALIAADGSDGFSLLLGESRTNSLRIESDFEAIRAMGAIIRFATTPIFSDAGVMKCVYIFLDEYDVIADFSNANAISISNGIRDLVNASPEALCILLGFTGDAARLEALVDESVIARMTTDPIELQPLDDDDALAFLREIHVAYRRAGAKVDQDFPFTEKGLRELISRTSERTPRQLLRSCRTVFEGAIGAGTFDGTKAIDGDEIGDLLI